MTHLHLESLYREVLRGEAEPVGATDSVIPKIDPERETGISALGKKAAVLGLDLATVAKRSEQDRATNYGVVLVAGYGIGGNVGRAIANWSRSVARITNDKIILASGFSHVTISSVVRSSATPIDREKLIRIDFEAMLGAIRSARPFNIRSAELKFGGARDGCIVLIVKPSGQALPNLRRALQRAGLPRQSDRLTMAHITLAHVGQSQLRGLSLIEVMELHRWVESHVELRNKASDVIKSLKLVMYRQRALRRLVAKTEILPLGRPSLFKNGNDLKEVIIKAFSDGE